MDKTPSHSSKSQWADLYSPFCGRATSTPLSQSFTGHATSTPLSRSFTGHATSTPAPQSHVKVAPRSKVARRSLVTGDFSFSAPLSTPSHAKVAPRSKVAHRSNNADCSFAAPLSTPSSVESEYLRKLKFNKLLTSVFVKSTIEERAKREKKQFDVKLTQLAERCESNVELLDKTHKRLNEMSFLAEKQRILDMKEDDCSNVFEQMGTSKAEKMVADLTTKQQLGLNRLETKNVDFGYSLQSGHRQLLDAMDDLQVGFKNIENYTKMSLENLNEHCEVSRTCGEVETHMTDLNELKKEFSAKFPSLSEQALIESSEELEKSVDEQSDMNEGLGEFGDLS